MHTAKPVVERVCAESSNKDNGMARYQCAYLLGLRVQQQAPDSALNVLQAWALDKTGKLYGCVQTKTSASGTERKGENQSKQVVTGDSRSMAVQALNLIGRERVAGRREIVEQLRHLSDDAQTFPDLRKQSKALLQKLGV